MFLGCFYAVDMNNTKKWVVLLHCQTNKKTTMNIYIWSQIISLTNIFLVFELNIFYPINLLHVLLVTLHIQNPTNSKHTWVCASYNLFFFISIYISQKCKSPLGYKMWIVKKNTRMTYNQFVLLLFFLNSFIRMKIYNNKKCKAYIFIWFVMVL